MATVPEWTRQSWNISILNNQTNPYCQVTFNVFYYILSIFNPNMQTSLWKISMLLTSPEIRPALTLKLQSEVRLAEGWWLISTGWCWAGEKQVGVRVGEWWKWGGVGKTISHSSRAWIVSEREVFVTHHLPQISIKRGQKWLSYHFSPEPWLLGARLGGET